MSTLYSRKNDFQREISTRKKVSSKWCTIQTAGTCVFLRFRTIRRHRQKRIHDEGCACTPLVTGLSVIIFIFWALLVYSIFIMISETKSSHIDSFLLHFCIPGETLSIYTCWFDIRYHFFRMFELKMKFAIITSQTKSSHIFAGFFFLHFHITCDPLSIYTYL